MSNDFLQGLNFSSLFSVAGLEKLDQRFLDFLREQNQGLYQQLLAIRNSDARLDSDFIIHGAPILEKFISELFDIESEVKQRGVSSLVHRPIFKFKHTYIKSAKRFNRTRCALPRFSELDAWVTQQLRRYCCTPEQAQHFAIEADRELAIALMGQSWLEDSETHAEQVEKMTHWCVQVLDTPEGQAAVKGWSMFKLPKRRPDSDQLISVETATDSESLTESDSVMKPCVEKLQTKGSFANRDGFELTDARATVREVYSEVEYCIYCHKSQTDFCSKGFPVKKQDPESELKVDALGEVMTGCPLEEHVSEMHVLKQAGHTIGALAAAMIENPLCAATGHRICNDCMRACIYQKQDPVDIPQVETRILVDVLQLPWGVEIYDLLIRWNPLRSKQWVPKPYRGFNVLVIGMGPAGFTLAHHLLMEGFGVVGTDGLKIEALPRDYIHEPIYSYSDIEEALDKRIIYGFGGVAEYGITVRWDKNFLKLIHLSLSRRPHFQVFGNVRFGGTLTIEDAWDLGFDHVAMAVGAGLPQALPIPNSLAPGMRQANDFLMALQLTGALKASSLSALHVRLPALVIGGGLTGVDTATELQAYYIKQVEQMLSRYEILVDTWGEAHVKANFGTLEALLLDEAVSHGAQVREERRRALRESRPPNLLKLIRAWGGVSIVYRKRMQDSPAYRKNNDELKKALAEGIYYIACLEPAAAVLDEHHQICGLICHFRTQADQGGWVTTDHTCQLKARSILSATGAKPNIAYAFEHKGSLARTGWQYQTFELDERGGLTRVEHQAHCKVDLFGPFTSYERGDYRVTFIGDTHPTFHGSVVKAMASGKRTYPVIAQLFRRKRHEQQAVTYEQRLKGYQQFAGRMHRYFSAQLCSIRRVASDVLELWIKAPIAVRNFLPGQFYRIQAFESDAIMAEHTLLHGEALAVAGVSVDKQKGLLRCLILERGASSSLVSTWQVGQALGVMGPTGVRTKIPEAPQEILLISDRLGLPETLSVGPALMEQGHTVRLFVVLKTVDEQYLEAEIESTFNRMIWVIQQSPVIKPSCDQTGEQHSFLGDIVSALEAYQTRLHAVERVLVMGGDQLISSVQEARQNRLSKIFHREPKYVGSVYGMMQCMLKGVCAQCLQWQIDPETGERTKAVFACSWQNQPMEIIDIPHIAQRLSQNRVQEVLNHLWLNYIFDKQAIHRC